MKVSDYVIDFLVSRGVTHVFEVCGGSITHLLDSLYGRKDITAVSMHHEQAAAFAAEGYARASIGTGMGGGIGVAMATSGPGATNFVTGIGSCYFDSIPCLFLTGQVNTYEFKFDRPVRQVGFQETDIVRIVAPIVKHAELIRDEHGIRYHLEKAVHVAKQGRPGPVLLDLPMNVQRAEVAPGSLAPFPDEKAPGEMGDTATEDVVRLIGSASRPVILAGGGIRLADATRELYELAHRTGIPVVASLMGRDAFPHGDLFCGMIGTYGNRYANLAVANADLVLALGTRLDSRQTGTMPETFARGACLVHVDIDPHELNNKIKADVAVNSDVKTFLAALNRRLIAGPDVTPWRRTIDGYRSRYPSFGRPAGDGIGPNHLMHCLSRYLPEDAIVCADVGQNQMWAAQSLELKRGQRFLTQGGMAAMGSALPMAIGASFAAPGRPVFVVTGDGGFQLNVQELETVRYHRLPIKVILLNNGCYGMVRQFQEQYFNGRLQSTVLGYSCPDYLKVANAYGIPAFRIGRGAEVGPALERTCSLEGPAFLEAVIGRDIVVSPKLSVGRPVEEQDPPLPREELRANMVITASPRPVNDRR